MRSGSGPSWQLRVNDPFDLFFALYVHAAVGIDAGADVPVLVAPVSGVTARWSDAQREAITRQWAWWWTELMTQRTEGPYVSDVDGPEFRFTVGAELREAQRMLFLPAHQWRTTHRLDASMMDRSAAMMPVHLVQDIEKSIGRTARPFRYLIEVLPTPGVLIRDVSTTVLIVSRRVSTDAVALREILLPRLTALA